ncbi:MAG: putative enoyl-CoA hydratase [Ilumatobacteraceae bacterium]|nr:putative enoyl-CoA hydratase [Ilumatobacteraceae bacterium]
MSAPLVSLAVADGIARITLDSPTTRNALSAPFLADFHAALDLALVDGVRVVVVGHAPPVFCAGADLKERTAGDVDSTPMARAMERLMSAGQVTIAEVSGPVRAGGVGLMAACDLVVVSPDVNFAFTEVRIGVAPAIISVPVLRRCPASRLAAAFLTGEPFTAEVALDMGLVTHVADDPRACVDRLVTGVLAGAPGAVAATKELLWSTATSDAGAELARMQALSDQLFRSAEGQEGMRAFLDKRSPSWRPA